MIDALVLDGTADPKRIYVTGGSNGGMMTMRLAWDSKKTRTDE
jgi:poly(3-hydroxybutyrate) depolymerase